jgi:hypothetical protein
MEEKSDKHERIYLDIDPAFSNICLKLTAEEKAFLTQSIIAGGCREPIRYWVEGDKKLIIDGHNRYETCLATGALYETVEVKLPNREAVVEWIVKNQLGRRNATEVQKQLLRGKLILERRQAVDAEVDVSPVDTEKPHGAMPSRRTYPGLTKSTAKETGVSEQRIEKDVAFTRTMGRLAQKSPVLRDAASKGGIDKKDAIILADAPVELLKSLEEVPESELRACASTAADGFKNHKPVSGAPIITVRPLADLDKELGKVVRKKTEAFEACGKAQWAAEFEERLRLAFIPCFDIILEWQKASEKYMGAT